MALPSLKRMNGFAVSPCADSKTRREAFIDCNFQNELSEIRRLFCQVYGRGVYKSLVEENNKTKLCFGCEIREDSEGLSFAAGQMHRCNMLLCDLFVAGSARIWTFLPQDDLREEWFKLMETSRKCTKAGILRFFQTHFQGCKVEFFKPERQKEIASILSKRETAEMFQK